MHRQTSDLPARNGGSDQSSEDSLSVRNPTELNMQAEDADSGFTTSTDNEKSQSCVRIILPHVGVVLLLVMYLLIGATIFHYIEAPNEMRTKERDLKEIFSLRDSFHTKIWKYGNSPNTTINRKMLVGMGQNYFEKLAHSIWVAYQHQYVNERHLLNRTHPNYDGHMLWTYPNSVFFSTTVLTTIGYGNMVPATPSGRVATILFAVLGITLLLVIIADLGKLLSDFLKFLYGAYRAMLKKRMRNKEIKNEGWEQSESSTGDALRVPAVTSLLLLMSFTFIGGFIFQQIEGMFYSDAIFFCFSSVATIDLGDLAFVGQAHIFITIVYIIVALSVATTCIDLVGVAYIGKIHYLCIKVADAEKAVVVALCHSQKHIADIELVHSSGIEEPYGPIIQNRTFISSSDHSPSAQSSERRSPVRELDVEAVANRETTTSTTSTEQSSDVQTPATKKEKLFHYAKNILPHVGLVLLLVVYLLIGATILYFIEAPNEMRTRERELNEIFALRDSFHARVWELTHSPKTTINLNLLAGVGQEYFKKLAHSIWVAYQHKYVNERHLLNPTHPNYDGHMLWTYPNSVFFSTSVLTTIGYGNMVPATPVGRVVCVLFAVFGIPILLVTVADIGKFQSDLLQFLYGKCLECWRDMRREKRRIERLEKLGSANVADADGLPKPPRDNQSETSEDGGSESSTVYRVQVPLLLHLLILLAYTAVGGFLFQLYNGQPYFDSFFYSFSALATISPIGMTPLNSLLQLIFTMLYIIVGRAFVTLCITLVGTEYIRKIHYIGLECSSIHKRIFARTRNTSP